MTLYSYLFPLWVITEVDWQGICWPTLSSPLRLYQDTLDLEHAGHTELQQFCLWSASRGKVECVEDGLHISFNTGRVITLDGKGELFGPFEAPKGFYIDGLRTKPVDKGNVKVTCRASHVRDIPKTYQRHGYRWRRLHFCNIIVFYICFNALHGEVRRCNVCNWMQLSSNGVWWMALASQLVYCCQDYVAGIEAAPLPSASEYDCPCALLYTAEQDFATSHFVCMRETHWDSIVLTCFDWLQTDFWFMFENRVPPVPVAILGVSWQVSPILSAQTITNPCVPGPAKSLSRLQQSNVNLWSMEIWHLATHRYSDSSGHSSKMKLLRGSWTPKGSPTGVISANSKTSQGSLQTDQKIALLCCSSRSICARFAKS